MAICVLHLTLPKLCNYAIVTANYTCLEEEAPKVEV